ncbi:unnamed protein product [Malus baccata var. baccata]
MQPEGLGRTSLPNNKANSTNLRASPNLEKAMSKPSLLLLFHLLFSNYVSNEEGVSPYISSTTAVALHISTLTIFLKSLLGLSWWRVLSLRWRSASKLAAAAGAEGGAERGCSTVVDDMWESLGFASPTMYGNDERACRVHT